MDIDTSDLFLILQKREKYRSFIGNCNSGELEKYKGLLEEIDAIYPNAMNVIEMNLDYLVSS